MHELCIEILVVKLTTDANQTFSLKKNFQTNEMCLTGVFGKAYYVFKNSLRSRIKEKNFSFGKQIVYAIIFYTKF